MRGRKKRKEAKPPEGAAGEPIFRDIEVDADAGEMLAIFKAAADEDQTAQRLEDELAVIKQTTKEARASADMATRSALHFARTGKVLRRVEIIEVLDENRGVMRLMRKDAPDVEVDTRALSAGELQALQSTPAQAASVLAQVGAFDFGEPPPSASAVDVASLAAAVQN
jgi:hypothetical protein